MSANSEPHLAPPSGGPARSSNRGLAAAAAGYAAFVLIVTLAPMPWVTLGNQATWGVLDPSLWLAPATWADGSPREFVLNVVLFAPLGALAARFGLRWGLLVPLLLTSGIEVMQITMTDRISDPRDLVANALGGVLGAVTARLPRPQA